MRNCKKFAQLLPIFRLYSILQISTHISISINTSRLFCCYSPLNDRISLGGQVGAAALLSSLALTLCCALTLPSLSLLLVLALCLRLAAHLFLSCVASVVVIEWPALRVWMGAPVTMAALRQCHRWVTYARCRSSLSAPPARSCRRVKWSAKRSRACRRSPAL